MRRSRSIKGIARVRKEVVKNFYGNLDEKVEERECLGGVVIL